MKFFECGLYFCLGNEACINQQCGMVNYGFHLGRTHNERRFHTIECEGTVVVTVMLQDDRSKGCNG